jgi:hypothetical protein
MERLEENWLTGGLIDFEYKKYVLLAYLKNVRDSFHRVELYPFLADLVAHYRNMSALKENKALIYDRFPKQLSLDLLKNLEVSYKNAVEDDAVMKEIEAIIEFSLPQLKGSLEEGAVIYEYVESQCEILPVGLTSLYANEGYLFISQPPEKETEIYRYQVTIFDSSSEILRGIHTQYLWKAERSISNTYEHLKSKLIREYRDLPNPSTYLVLSKLKFPFTHTLMPVAKRLLVKQLSATA